MTGEPQRIRAEATTSERGVTERRALPYIYIVINLACAAMFWAAAHRVSALMRIEQRTDSDSVDGITFFFAVAPAMLVGVVANIAWAGKALADVTRRQSYRTLAWLGVGAAVWVAAWAAATIDARLR